MQSACNNTAVRMQTMVVPGLVPNSDPSWTVYLQGWVNLTCRSPSLRTSKDICRLHIVKVTLRLDKDEKSFG